jgi:TolB-like protein/tetratricopeptide (TPR) repeat protein
LSETKGAVFLSYASEDTAAAQRICLALRAAGFEVWFDQSELRGGDAWDAAIRNQIKSCALFVPIISVHSRARVEGYFRLEWKLAVDRSHLMAAEKPFLVPVVIDDTKDADARVPDRFHEIQWIRLLTGEATPEFLSRMHRLLAPVDPEIAPAPRPNLAPAASLTPRRPVVIPIVVMTLLLIAALIYIGVTHRSTPNFSNTSPAAPIAPTPVPTAMSDKTIAVLPFTDLSEKKDQQYFSDGLSEELIDLLAQIPELKVTARTSSFSFRDRPVTVAEIGQALKVANVLEGSVRKAGNTARITAQLVRADNGYHIWSATYDRDLKDVFKVQDDIARVVVDKLKVTLTGALPVPAARTENPEAHNLLLKGTFALQTDTDAGTTQALAAFQSALAIDPGYAPAWNGTGWARFRRGVNGYEPVGSALIAAEVSGTRAIELDPGLADSYALLGSIRMLQFNWQTTSELLDKALQLDPANSNALITRAALVQATESPVAAIAAIHQALDRDPRNLLSRRYAARIFLYAGRLDEAESVLRQILVFSPTFSAAHYELGRVLLARGNIPAAVSEFESESNPFWRIFGLPLGYYAAKRPADLNAALRELLRHPDGAEFQVAETYAYLGDTDKAFEFLNRALTTDPGIIWLPHDPFCASLVADARYKAILKRMNLPVLQ